MKLNRKGYLTVEIILAFAIAFFLIEITVKLVSKTDDIYRDTIITTDSSIVTRNIKKEIKKVINEEENNKTISNITCINDKECKIIFKDTNNNSITKCDFNMALNKPIITTNMNECRKYKSVLIGKNYEDFIKKLDEAMKLKNDKKYLDLLTKEAKDNDWSHKAKVIIDYIKKDEK